MGGEAAADFPRKRHVDETEVRVGVGGDLLCESRVLRKVVAAQVDPQRVRRPCLLVSFGRDGRAAAGDEQGERDQPSCTTRHPGALHRGRDEIRPVSVLVGFTTRLV